MKSHWITAAALSLGLGIAGCSNMMHKDKDKEADEGDEVSMKLADVPAPVRDTLTREANGAAIDKVDKETKDGKVVYETDVMSGGKTWELRVDPDGKMI